MQPSDFASARRGTVRKTLDGYYAFFPEPLPRHLDLSKDAVLKVEKATAALNRLGGVGRLLPNPQLLIWPNVRLEAVLSSKIEGTEATVSDLLRFEAEGPNARGSVPPDVQEVANYILALEYGTARIADGFPIVLRLIREIHERLMQGVRGDRATPGEFRRSQNWIGPPGCVLRDATFVPPPVVEMHEALGDLERFLNEEPELPLLVQLAMVHYQFEVIHPFLDGNGRVGRLLVPLVLQSRGVLTKPLLYLSVFFERHRQTYYELLLQTSQSGDFDRWVQFFLDAVTAQATDAEERTVRLVELQEDLRNRLLEEAVPISVVRLGEYLFNQPYVTASSLKTHLGVTFPTAQKAIETLVRRGDLLELTGRSRGRVYYAPEIYNAVYGPIPTENEEVTAV